MMCTSPMFESDEAARSQVERLRNQLRLMLGHNVRPWRRFKTLQKQFFSRGLAEPQTMSTATGSPNKLIIIRQ